MVVSKFSGRTDVNDDIEFAKFIERGNAFASSTEIGRAHE
jgi:hypothetical protein